MHHLHQEEIPSSEPHTRPTIAYLAHGIDGDVGRNRWLGIVDAVEAHDANLLCFVGDYCGYPGLRQQANMVYNLVPLTRLDGLVMGNIVRESILSPEEIDAFYARFPLPTVGFVKSKRDDIPYISSGQYEGVRAALGHLIEIHACRRIAFVRGPDTQVAAQEQYRAYLDTVREYNLPHELRLITPPCSWDNEPYDEGIRVLFDERGLRPGVDLDAIFLPDVMALYLIRFLASRGIRVPADLAVVGVDNRMEGAVFTPPLTTVQLPFYEQGRHVVEMVLDNVAGKSVSESMTLPAKLIVRRSCGCLSPAVAQAAVSLAALPESFGALDADRRNDIATRMAYAVESVEAILPLTRQLVDSFVADLHTPSPDMFLATLENVLGKVGEIEGTVGTWHNALSILRRECLPILRSSDLLNRAEDLLQQARVLQGEVAERTRAAARFREQQQQNILSSIGSALATTFEIENAMDILAQELPRLGIPGGYVALYENPGPYHYPQAAPEWSRLILAYNEQVRIPLDAQGERFLSHQLLPEQIFPQHRRYALLVMPLYFQTEQLGFAVFEMGPSEGSVYMTLQTQISSVLQGGLLVQHVQERSVALAQANAELAREKYIIDTFFETVPDRIWFKDREGRTTRANQAYVAGLGLQDPSEVLGKTDFDFFGEESARVRSEEEQEILRTGLPMLNKEVSGTWPDGSQRWSLITKMALRDEHGEIIGTFGASRDITELKNIEQALRATYQELREKNAQLEELNTTKDKFFSIISHDLRSPLSTLLGFTNLLHQHFHTYSAEEALYRIGRIREAADRLYALLENLLTWARLQRGTFPYEPELLDLSDIADEIVDLFLDKAEQKQIRLHSAVVEEAEVYADAPMVQTVLRNLVSNALKFCSQDGEISLAAHTRDALWMEVEVTDTGIGIPPEDLCQLFRIDTQYTKSGTSGEQGTGLGLNLCKELVERHGGQIWVESKVGKGTTFRFTLPRQKLETDSPLE